MKRLIITLMLLTLFIGWSTEPEDKYTKILYHDSEIVGNHGVYYKDYYPGGFDWSNGKPAAILSNVEGESYRTTGCYTGRTFTFYGEEYHCKILTSSYVEIRAK